MNVSNSDYVGGIISKFKNKLIPKEYEDVLFVDRSIINYNDVCLKNENLIAFNQTSSNEVIMFL